MKRLFQDWAANHRNPKGRLLTLCFRLASILRSGPRYLWPCTIVYGILYRLTIEWILGVELPWKTIVGTGLRIDHGQGLVVNDGTIIGKNCRLRNSVTIGNKRRPDGTFTGCPVLGDRVDVGANAVIIGPISIGDDVTIGAGAVVVKDVPSGAVIAGNPAKIIKILPSSRQNLTGK